FNAALLSVRQASILLSASFRFHLTMNTLAVQLTLPLAGCVEDLHLQITSLTTTVNLVALTRNAPCLAHTKKAALRLPMSV
ncbi:MAG: hypothetical protein KJ556_12155, partial [Gammaproteobacteria bacterium]|nr:hypothetical protein [Gammaproteobacteria bacterium]MBU2247696.1 hypothetical protein [Gammaproteobacteria bacterium]